MFERPTQVFIEEASPPTPSVPQPLVERLSDGAQRAIQVVVGANRKPPRKLKSCLNGTFLGHPLHPAITNVPTGAWLLAAIFDVIWLISPSSFAWAGPGAKVVVVVGILAALGAIVTGLTDWSDTAGSERKIGFYHGLLSISATILYIISLVLRFQQPSGDSLLAAIIGFVGLAAVGYTAYLGGEMVFTKGTGVNHTAWEAASDGYEAVLPAEQVEENKPYRVMVAGVPVLVLRQGPRWYTISATCPHAGGPLDEGKLEGGVVECPWHGARFRLRDGRVLTGPARVNAPCYDARVHNGQVEVKRVSDE